MEKELEVKVLGVDVKKIEDRIIDLGGILLADEEQVNTLIDSKERPIKSYLDAYLRIRETKDLISGDKRTELTLKKNIQNKELRENEELNTVLESKETMLLILNNLGFNSISVGYKHRKSYKFMEGRVDIDTWDKETYPEPYIEIEVKDEKDLKSIIAELEIEEDKISRLSIVELKKNLDKKVKNLTLN